MAVAHPRKSLPEKPQWPFPFKDKVEASAQQRLSEHPAYSFHFRDIDFDYEDGVLRLRGCLPSFYLKQVLQTALKDVDGVRRIDNQVDVIDAVLG